MVATGKGFAAVLEAALPVANQFADRLGVDVAFLVLAGKAEWRMSSFFFQTLELCLGEGGQKYMVILALSFMPLGGLGRDEPGAFFQIHMAPFGFEQLTDTAKGAQANPDGALHAWIDGADAGVFLSGGEGVVVAFQAGEDVVQLADFVRGK